VVERGEPGNRWFFHAARSIEDAIAAGHFPPAPGPTCFECEFGRACLEWGQPQAVQHQTARRSSFHASQAAQAPF
jgi:hypothetical protein